MANPYYNHGSFPATGSAGASASMRAELDAITAGFGKLPGTLTANNVIFVNSSGTALEARAGIDGVVIGGTTPAAGTFTTLSANTVTLSSGFVLPLGAVGTPSLSFTGDSNTGLYSPGADQVALTAGGVQQLLLTTALAQFASPVLAPAGAVGTPGFGFSGDANNGWWAPAADTQAWSLAGTELMRLTSSGLGVGMSPIGDSAGYGGKVLDIAGPLYARQSSDTTKYLSVGTSGGVSFIEANGTGNQIAFLTVAAERMRINASGNIGIGLIPTSGWRAGATALQVGVFASVWTQSNGSANIGFGLYEGGTNTFNYSTTGDIPTLYSQVSGNHIWYRATGSGTTGGAVTLTENGRFDTNGNFGLGVAPTYDLDAVKTKAAGQTIIRVKNPSSAAGLTYGGFLVESDTVLGGVVAWSSAGTRPGQLWLSTSSVHPLILGTSDTERLRISSSGDVTMAGRFGAGPAALIGGVQIQASSPAASAASIRIVQSGGGDWQVYNPASGADLRFYNGADRLAIDSTGFANFLFGSGALRLNGHISRFESSEQSVPTTTFASNTLTHGGSRVPDVCRLVLRCKTAELGYSVGDEVDVTLHNHTMSDRAFNVWHSTTQTGYVWITGLNVAPSISHKTTGTMTTVTAANWRVVVYNHWL